MKPCYYGRRSERKTKGLIPERLTYGSKQPKQKTAQKKSVTADVHAENDKSTENFDRYSQTRRSDASHSETSRYSKSRRSGTSSASTIKKRQIEIDLAKAEEIARIERKAAEHQRVLVEQEADRQKKLAEMRAQLEQAKLDERLESLSGESNEDRESVRSACTEQTSVSKVRSWIGKSNNLLPEKTKKNVTNDDQKKKEIPTDELMPEVTVSHKYMARQALDRDLPPFDGNPADWQLSIGSFRESTRECGFSPRENMLRLRKCLKGEALEAVRASLVFTNVEKVITTLQRRFGRPEYIIDELTSQVTGMPNVRDDKPMTLIKFADAVSNLVTTVESLQSSGLTDSHLLKLLIGKLPNGLKNKWGEAVAQNRKETTMDGFSKWLEERANAAIVIYERPTHERDKSKRVFAVSNGEEKEAMCAHCSKAHKIENCPQFKKLTVDERWKWVTMAKVCFCCLSTEHTKKDCTRKTCGKDGCKWKHHRMLHHDRGKSVSSASQTGSSEPKPSSSKATEPANANGKEVVNFTCRKRKTVLLMILPVTLYGPAGQIDTHAFLDSGSTVTLHEEEAAIELGLHGHNEPLNSQWITDDIEFKDQTSRLVNLHVQGQTGKKYKLTDVQTVRQLSLPAQTVMADIEKWPHLKNIDVVDLSHAQPRVLIGMDHEHLIRVKKTIAGKPGAPVVSFTELGWTIHGKYDSNRVDKDFTLFFYQKRDDVDLHDILKYFWTTESFGVSPTQETLCSSEEKRAKEIIEKTARRTGNRWEVGLLWRTDMENLPESRKNAERRFASIERKLAKDPEFGKIYLEKLNDYEKKGYARRLTEEEAAHTGPRTWYLPHFAVIHPHKPMKPRLVFDAAARSHGISLNDRLLKGPDLLNSLLGVLFTLRQGLIAICGDLKEMFPQVRIREEDQDSQRYLQRDEKTGKLIVLRMQSMIFGAICSPYIAHETRNRNTKEFQEDYPDACRAITERHYMDDYLDSVNTAEEAIRKAHDVAFIHLQGGFEVRNWMSNSTELLQTLPQDALAPSGSGLNFNEENLQRVLGVIWAPDSDCFTFKTDFPKVNESLVNGEKTPTKREVLRIVMSVFDPLGLLTVLMLKAKLLMQEIWRRGSDWDEQIPDELLGRWTNWLEDLQRAKTLRIPRCYVLEIGEIQEVQLHVFCDASEQAFAACAYFRIQGTRGIKVSLVMAKSRVTPLKILTIPRLELQAAVMACRLSHFVSTQHTLQIDKKVLWTDSRTVLCWLKSDARKYLPFVAHRIAEILDNTAMSDWRWVPTKENVADDATRGTSFQDGLENDRWFKGPGFLHRPETEWPKEKVNDVPTPDPTTLEMKKEFCGSVITTQEALVDAKRFYSWLRLIRTRAWVRRLCDIWSKKVPKMEKNGGVWELTSEEIQRAELDILIQAQKESYADEWIKLKRGQPISKSSKIQQLSPKMENELIEMDGRVAADMVASADKIILDGKHPITQLLVMHYHRKAGHHGRERVVNDLRQKFYIPQIRTVVKKAWSSCLLCQHRRSMPAVPRMAPLPAPRVQNRVRPFTDTGVDYFGPIYVTIGRRREKRYGVLFTCLTVRAVHLEIAALLTTDSMIMALR